MREAWGQASLRICGVFIAVGLATALAVALIETAGGSAQTISWVRFASLIGAYGISVASLLGKRR